MEHVTEPTSRHPGPHLGLLALVHVGLFSLGLWFVLSTRAAGGHFPRPWMPPEDIAAYFETHARDMVRCAFLQFGSAIPLGLFTATVASRLRFLGVRAAGAHIALFGGLMAAFDVALAALLLWAIAYPNAQVVGVANDVGSVRSLFYTFFSVGSVGYSVPFGLLVVGVSVSAGAPKLIPRWLMTAGIAVAVCGETSWLALADPRLSFLVPLTRVAGSSWMIVVGFVLPSSVPTGATPLATTEPQPAA